MSAYFDAEPECLPTQCAKTGILLCNLGTPDAPSPQALRRYLAEFLSDKRVVELSDWLWKPLLHGIILRLRPAESAAKYAKIWMDDAGSPLWYWSQRQASLLQERLAQAGWAVQVSLAMRYGKPSVAAQLNALKARGAQRILVLPLYPQYSAPTTASVLDAVCRWALRTRHVPELRFVNRYHAHPAYIAALAHSVRRHWQREGGPAELLVMSFHGMPVKAVQQGDPYLEECRGTVRLLAQALDLRPEQYLMSFQSRFGKDAWLEPYTQPTLERLARQGLRRVDVMCPGFASDCLETLEEINMEVRRAFVAAGGQVFRYIACLNDDAAWMDALSEIAQTHLQGWMQPGADI